MKCEYCGKIVNSGVWTKDKNKKVIWVCCDCITSDMLIVKNIKGGKK